MPYGRGSAGSGGMSIGGTVTGGTSGSVLFIGAASVLAQDNANFFWDDAINRLELGGDLLVVGNIELSATDTTLARAAAGRVSVEGVGLVRGPGAATDNAVVRFDATTGDLVQDSSFVVDDSGNVSSFGGQITFPAVQSPSAGANTLDDYEEGTWTPTDASGAGLSLTINGTPRYTKIGERVIGEANVTYPVTADASLNRIGGWPFTVPNNLSLDQGNLSSSTEATAFGHLVLLNTATSVTVDNITTNLTNATLSGDNLVFQASYPT